MAVTKLHFQIEDGHFIALINATRILDTDINNTESMLAPLRGMAFAEFYLSSRVAFNILHRSWFLWIVGSAL